MSYVIIKFQTVELHCIIYFNANFLFGMLDKDTTEKQIMIHLIEIKQILPQISLHDFFV
ncbi:hypothetical protein CCAND93_720024 [Capnocytophaga canis]|uniref:Uncharacterized protein n=1 Tax=Capnocytophaga canis TaxID=1848903 RepID=A0A0B7IQE6_9FLAO|nr:hypothetical protein CCAND93_720024 [Capnocytophaga canis]